MRWPLVPLIAITACTEERGDGGERTGPYFTEAMFFNEDISTAPVSPHSEEWLAELRAAGGWGGGGRMLIGFDFTVLHADASTPRRAFQPDRAFFYEPDCDHVEIPVPRNGQLEGEAGYECRNGGDCHLLVYDAEAGTLYEMWKANLVDAAFYGGCVAVWHTRGTYGDALRGEQCASADGAGFPISPLLFTADEVAAGEIAHAIRFVLPNDRIRRTYVRPATHATDTTGSATAPPYGVHLRLRADYPVDSLPTAGARVVARTLQTYGMFHADGGEYALTAEADTYTGATWRGLLGPADLDRLRVEDFEVVDHGEPYPLTFRCQR